MKLNSVTKEGLRVLYHELKEENTQLKVENGNLKHKVARVGGELQRERNNFDLLLRK